jgi:hypothetical protein
MKINAKMLQDIDKLYLSKCEEVNDLKEEIRRLKCQLEQQTAQKRVYISGPISGVIEAEEYFREAEQKIEAAGFIAINPCTLINGGGKLKWEDYIDMDLAILKKCNCIYMLNGWQNSRGATLEKEFAEKHNIPELVFSR